MKRFAKTLIIVIALIAAYAGMKKLEDLCSPASFAQYTCQGSEFVIKGTLLSYCVVVVSQALRKRNERQMQRLRRRNS